MTNVYEFAISRKLSVVLGLCCALAAILLFVAGTMSGLLLSPRYSARAQPTSGSLEAKVVAAAKPASAAQAEVSVNESPSGGGASAQPIVAPAQSASQAPPAALAAQAATQPSAASALSGSKQDAVAPSPISPSSPAAAPASTGGSAVAEEQPAATAQPNLASASDIYPVSLAVQVGSFLVEDNANRLSQSLKQLGYPAEIVQRLDARQRMWFIVRLGPYHKWDTASGVALRLASNQDLSPVVGPM